MNPFGIPKIAHQLFRLIFCLTFMTVSNAAVNPEAFKSGAEESLLLKEISNLSFKSTSNQWFSSHSWSQIYIVAEVVEVHRSKSGLAAGDQITIFYRLDHEKIRSESRDHQRKMRGMVGRQFLYLPSPPKIEENGTFWAHLRELNVASVHRLAGLEDDWEVELRGKIYAPAAYQYSFEKPFIDSMSSNRN